MSLQTDARFWDRTADKYAADPIADMGGYERTLQATRNRLKANDVVLELGCGTGTTALRLAPSVDRFVATDLSRRMIEIAQAKAAVQGIQNITFKSSSLVDESRAGARYDAVLAFNVLHLISDLRAALCSANRLLGPGGLFISKTTCLALMNPVIRLLVPAMRIVGQAPSSVSFYSPTQIEAAFVAANFEILERDWHSTTGKRDARLYLVARKSGECCV